MRIFHYLFPRRPSRREAEMAYLRESVSRYDLERRERDIAAGRFASF